MRAVPRIGITLGDPAGIGPEIIVKGLSRAAELPDAAYILFGSGRVLEDEQRALGLTLPLESRPPAGSVSGPGIFLCDLELPLSVPIKGQASAEGGRASFEYFARAVEEAERKELTAIVTAPISKRAWSLAGVEWRGHTEYLARTHPEAIMAFWSEPLKVALLSHHLPLQEALARVKADLLEAFFLALDRSLSRRTSRRFRFLAAGLNPHAGENGLMGGEEEEIRTAIGRARAAGMEIEGPFPPDTVFRRALGCPNVMVAAMYHDQGLIPFKLVAFETGVNFTLGLPFIRTSPDHGTAYDIAGRRIADPTSFLLAVRLAIELA